MEPETLSPPAAINGVRQKIARSKFGQLPSLARKVIVGVIGGTIVVIGLLMIFLPGPAVVVIPLGLGILATEFVWARRVVKRGKLFLRQVKRKVAR